MASIENARMRRKRGETEESLDISLYLHRYKNINRTRFYIVTVEYFPFSTLFFLYFCLL